MYFGLAATEGKPPADFVARRAHEQRFRSEHGAMAASWNLDFPWDAMDDAETAHATAGFGRLLDARGH